MDESEGLRDIEKDNSDNERVAFNCLQKYITYFQRFNLSETISEEILREFAKMYLSDGKTEELISKLNYASQFSSNAMSIRVSQARRLKVVE